MKNIGKLGIVIAVLASLGLAGCVSAQRAHLADEAFPVTVDHGASIEDLARDGAYGWVYSEVSTRNFPPTSAGTEPLTVRLVRLGSLSSVDKLVAVEEANGLRPADVRELLAFGKAYPDIQRVASIVGFGSHQVYTTVEYERFGMGPFDVERVIKRQNFYPGLIHGLFGRSVALIQEDMIPSFDPGGFFGCFVETGS
jgi:hypothetical protein